MKSPSISLVKCSLNMSPSGLSTLLATIATLQKPATGGYVTEGKHGIHSEHLGFLLAEMQSLARAIPEATW